MKRKAAKTTLENGNGIRSDIRHLGVLIENVHDDVKLVAEQHGDIKQTLDTHTEMIGSLAADVEIIKTDIEFIKTNLDTKADADELSMLEKRVGTLERDQ